MHQNKVKYILQLQLYALKIISQLICSTDMNQIKFTDRQNELTLRLEL